jgi:hypothetical protein
LLPYQELDDAVGLTEMAGDALTDTRRGKNGRHGLVGQFRQSVFGRLGGYDDVNDADRLSLDPAMRWIVGGHAVTKQAASTSQLGRFETEVLASGKNLAALADLSGQWIDSVHDRRSLTRIILDMEDDWEGVLKPVVVRYNSRKVRLYFRGDAAFVSPEMYEYLEAEGLLYAIRLPANRVLQESIAHLLTRPVGRPPNHVRRFYASFSYQAGSWGRNRRVVAFYNQRGKAEQYIKEGKNAIRWTRLSCLKFHNNAVRLQLHALAYNLVNFMRTLALPKEVEHWSLTTLREKLVKIGAKVVSHGRYVTFQLAEVAVPRDLFRRILRLIDDLRPRRAPA